MPKSRNQEEGLKSLAKVVSVLECFSVDRRALSVGEVSAMLDYPSSTTHRLLASMKAAGLLDQDRERGRYKLGLRLFGLGNIVLANMDLHREAGQAVEALQATTGLAVHLAVFDGYRAVVVRRASPGRDNALPANMLESAPSHCTGVGKAALAFQDEAVIEKVIATGLPRFTDATLTAPDRLRAELAATRERGYSIDEGEHQPGVRCVGAPIRDENDHVFAAISVTGPAFELKQVDLDDLAKIVMHHADQISRRLGWVRRDP